MIQNDVDCPHTYARHRPVGVSVLILVSARILTDQRSSPVFSGQKTNVFTQDTESSFQAQTETQNNITPEKQEIIPPQIMFSIVSLLLSTSSVVKSSITSTYLFFPNFLWCGLEAVVAVLQLRINNNFELTRHSIIIVLLQL